jgi:hypothetical protein
VSDNTKVTSQANVRRTALRFVLLIGILSFFADFTYEGSRSILGPYLATLGASAFVVGVVSGLGELLGYGLRLVSGRFADRTQKFWPTAIFGSSLWRGAGRWRLCSLSWSASARPPATRRAM